MKSLACWIITAAVSASGAGMAQVITDYQSAEILPLKPAIADVDTTGIWFHIQQKQTQMAEEEYRRLKQKYPAWQPSPNLSTALQLLKSPPQPKIAPPTAEAKSHRLASESVLLSHRAGLSEQAQQLFLRLSKLTATQRLDVSQATLDKASDVADNAGRPDYHQLLGWIYVAQEQHAQALTQFQAAQALLPATNTKNDAYDGVIASVTALTTSALQNNNLQAVSQWLDKYPAIGLDQLVGSNAWQAYQQQNFSSAIQLFELTGNIYGQVLSLVNENQQEKATALACENDATPQLARLCADQLSVQQAMLYDAKDYRASLKKADAMAARRALSAPEAQLTGWALLALKQHTAAQKVFNTLLRREPDNQIYAQGLLQSLDNASAIQRFADLYPAVARLVNQQNSQNAWQRKQFQLARQLGHDQSKQVMPENTLAVFAGLTSYNRSGSPGLGHFDRLGSYIGITDKIANWQWQFDVQYQQLYSGQARAGNWFGDGQVNDNFNSPTGVDGTGIAASVQYEHTNATYYAQLGYSLFDQPVSARLQGQLAGVWFTQSSTLGVTLYQQPVAQSLLSLASTYFENSSEAWGAVYKTGVRGLYSQALTPQWALSFSGVADKYYGTQVIDNDHLSARIDISKAINIDTDVPLDFLRVGPFVSWEGFEHNASGFTRGHGGYFSPEDLATAGLSGSVLTAEGQRWQIKSDINVGYSWINEQHYSRFALTAEGPKVEAQRRSGRSAQITVQAQWQLSRNILLTGFFGRNFAVEYQATQAGIQIRWQPLQSGVTSDTLLLEQPALSGFAF